MEENKCQETIAIKAKESFAQEKKIAKIQERTCVVLCKFSPRFISQRKGERWKTSVIFLTFVMK